MRTAGKLFGLSLLLVAALNLLSPAQALGHETMPATTHNHHAQQAPPMARYALPDCASVCGQTPQAGVTTITVKDARHKDEKQPSPEAGTPTPSHHAPLEQPSPRPYLPATTQIYKLTCSYLFYDCLSA